MDISLDIRGMDGEALKLAILRVLNMNLSVYIRGMDGEELSRLLFSGWHLVYNFCKATQIIN